jgi:AcrR family transcriptional regulator
MARSAGQQFGAAAAKKGRGGDLAAALVQAAEALIVERGPRGFSLREVARRARVSEAAPYWHFANKEALLATVAEAGFSDLAAAMEAVRRRVKNPGRRLRALGVAYVHFALAHPAHFRIMFGPEIADKASHPGLKAAAERAFGQLVSAVADAQRTGQVRDGDAEEMTVAAWALVHGLSALLIDRQLEHHGRTTRDADTLAGRITRLLQTGLEPHPAKR